jgi:hypothetical protein
VETAQPQSFLAARIDASGWIPRLRIRARASCRDLRRRCALGPTVASRPS